MGDVAHELSPGIVDVLQAGRHIVEGGGEIRQFLAAGDRRAGGEIAAAQLAGRLTDLLDGFGDAPRHHHAEYAAHNDNDQRGDQEHIEHIPHIGAQGVHGRGGKKIPGRTAHIDAASCRIVPPGIDAAQGALLKDIPAGIHLGQQIGGNLHVPEILRPGVKQHIAPGIRHKHHRARGGVEQFKSTAGVFHQRLIVQRHRHNGALGGKTLGQRRGAVQHRSEGRLTLPHKVSGGHGGLNAAHHGQAKDQHHRDGGKEFTADGFAAGFFPRAAHSLTSNL